MGQYWALFWNPCIWACFCCIHPSSCLNTFGHQSLSSALVHWLLSALAYSLSIVQTYFPAFHACVSEGGAKSIMCSYNAVNGVPSCANGLFQNTVVRDEWGFDGYIVSERERDWGVVLWSVAVHVFTLLHPLTYSYNLVWLHVRMYVCMYVHTGVHGF